MMNFLHYTVSWLPLPLQTISIILFKIVALLIPLLVCVAWLTYAERKIIGYMQVRIGPNRVGPRGLLQPIADGLKLLMKEIIIPTNSFNPSAMEIGRAHV